MLIKLLYFIIMDPIKNQQRSLPPKRTTVSPISPINNQKLPPRIIKTPQKPSSLPKIKNKKPFLISLREENSRIREELKQISKQLSMHINRQIREKVTSNFDFEKEARFLEGNLVNSLKRMEIADHEYDAVRAMLLKEGKFGKQLQLKKTLKEIEDQ